MLLLGGCTALTDFAPASDGGRRDAPSGADRSLVDGPESDAETFVDGETPDTAAPDGPADAMLPPDGPPPDAPPPPPDGPPPPECVFDFQCNDSNACTDDHCILTHCIHAPRNCSDNIDCTTDACNPGLGCTHDPNHTQCDDGAFCTVDVCSLTAGCQHTPDDSKCVDNDPCTNDQCTIFAAGPVCEHIAISNCCSKDKDCPKPACEALNCPATEERPCKSTCMQNQCVRSCAACDASCIPDPEPTN